MGQSRTAVVMDGGEILAAITFPEAAAAVEQAFLAWADGEVGEPQSLGLSAGSGTFHVKACASGAIFVAKTNANFPGNPARGMPTIQGVVAVFSVADGRLLMLLDSPAITSLRTAATTITAIRHLAPGARDAAIIGCGALGRFHAQALRECLGFEPLRFFDADAPRAAGLAAWARESLGVAAEHCATVREATLPPSVVVTCTSSAKAFLGVEDVKPGALVAGVGADNPQKAELLPSLLASARLVDCGVRGALAGAIRGEAHRAAPGERVVFRSTGIAIEDLALATLLVAKCGIDCG